MVPRTARRDALFYAYRIAWRKRKGIEPSEPSLARGSIGFEDRGRHQSGTRFHAHSHTADEARQAGGGRGGRGVTAATWRRRGGTIAGRRWRCDRRRAGWRTRTGRW